MLSAEGAGRPRRKATSMPTKEAVIVSSDDDDSSDAVSDNVLNPKIPAKRKAARTRKQVKKKPAPSIPVEDDDDESMSEGILGIGKPRNAKGKGKGSASAPVKEERERTTPRSAGSASGPPSGKGKEKAYDTLPDALPSYKGTGASGNPVVLDDSDAESDVSASILSIPQVKTEAIPMGMYTQFATDVNDRNNNKNNSSSSQAPPAEDLDDLIAEALNMREISIGVIHAKVVGIRYYNGMALLGEMVKLTREPNNAYDRFAIRVDNQRNAQVGHIPAATAKTLSPLLDVGKLRLEGEVSGTKSAYDLPLRLNAFCLPENQNEVRAALSRGGIGLQAYRPLQGTYGPGTSGSAMLQKTMAEEAWAKLLKSGQKLEIEDAAGLLAELGLPTKALSEIKMAPQPEGMTTPLLPYQRQGLFWMMEAEHPRVPKQVGETTQFWTLKRDMTGNLFYQNLATTFGSLTRPNFMRGGVLADDMGLGKTIQVLSLILTDTTPVDLISCDLPTSLEHCKATLLVAPLSVIDGWRIQIDKHIAPERNFQYHVYHGADRGKKTKREMGECDLVITTYGTLAQPGCELLKMKWRRVVLDEGHNIRTHSTQQSQACANVVAERRWVISGTPLQNGVDDVFGLIKFLGLEPFNDINWWRRLIGHPVKRGEETGLHRLKMLMQFLCLRRTKKMKFDGKPLLALPPCQLFLHKVKFYPEEEKVYKALELESRDLFRKFEEKGDDEVMRQYACILEILMRLRQVCNHKDLIGNRELMFLDKIMSGDVSNLDWKDPALQKVINLLRENEGEDCAICLDTLKDPAVTPCFHFFCSTCIQDVISRSTNLGKTPCPLCRAEIKVGQLMIPPPEVLAAKPAEEDVDVKDDEEDEDEKSELNSSSKIDALMAFLLQGQRKDPTSKSVVFSQWAKMLDKVEPVLRHFGIDYVRFDGSMSVKKRDAAVARFQNDPDCKVFLSTLKSGGLGLNLTAANHSFILDPWWNPSIEDQAVDRIYRLGQTRECTVVRFVIDHTVEDRVMELQSRKRKLVKDAMGEGRIAGPKEREKAREQRLAELRALFHGNSQQQQQQPQQGAASAGPSQVRG